MSSTVQAIKRLHTALGSLQRFILIAVSLMAIVNMLIEVIARYLFDESIAGLEEFTGHAAVWIYMIGAAYGSYEKSHIKADFLHLLVKNKRMLLAVRSVGDLVAVVVSLVLLVWSWEYLSWSIEFHEITPTLMIPTALFQASIFVSAVLMTVYFCKEMIDNIKGIWSVASTGSAPDPAP